MRTRKHGQGMTHKQVTNFSNRMARHGILKIKKEQYKSDFTEGFDRGWTAACKYFTHELRQSLRECELTNEI